jgi:hypothetical protein
MDMLKSIFVGLLESENVHSDNRYDFLDKTTIYKQNKEKPGRASNQHPGGWRTYIARHLTFEVCFILFKLMYMELLGTTLEDRTWRQ